MGMEMDAKVIVAIDFGTTYSGFAYAHQSNPNEVYIFDNWPAYIEAGGGRRYCKTQTSLFYSVTGPFGSVELKAWGWPALLEYVNALEGARDAQRYEYETSNNAEIISVTDANNNMGYFLTKFKLYLAPGNPEPVLPTGLTVEKLVVDYLRAISEFAMGELKLCYGENFSKSDVKWCITVPAIWDECAKQTMEICAEKAGMVVEANCRDVDASCHPLSITLEPEAASIYSQKQLHSLREGDKFLVADIGGGTIDLALHQKVDNGSLQVREVGMSSGCMGGGTFVDINFLNVVWKKLSFFKSFSESNPKAVMELMSWWLARKCGFHGSPNTLMPWQLPASLSTVWKEYDRSVGYVRNEKDYELMVLNSSDLREIFDPEVSKVVDLIKEQTSAGGQIKAILVVGGFSENKYLVQRIKKKFHNVEVIVPPNAGSAVVHGAVRLGFQSELVVSRVCKWTYGLKSCLSFRPRDPPESKKWYDGEAYCSTRFNHIVKRNQSILKDSSSSITVYSVSDRQRKMSIDLYSSESENPQYITEDGCEKIGTYSLDITDGMHLGRERKVEVTMSFGKSRIEVSAKRLNFGSRVPEKLYFVKLENSFQTLPTDLSPDPPLMQPGPSPTASSAALTNMHDREVVQTIPPYSRETANRFNKANSRQPGPSDTDTASPPGTWKSPASCNTGTTSRPNKGASMAAKGTCFLLDVFCFSPNGDTEDYDA